MIRCKLFLLIIILTAISCSSVKEMDNLKGKYVWKGIYGVGEKLTLNTDNTFELEWYQGLINGISKGTFSITGNSITLNSNIQPETRDFFKIKYLEQKESDKYFIKVINQDKEPLGFVSFLYLKNNETIDGKEINENGTLSITKNHNADKIKIQLLGYNDAEIRIEDLKSNSFEIELFFQSFEHYEYFTNKKLKISKNRIIRNKKVSDGNIRKVYIKKN